jgi:hypothetical protein
MFGKKASCPSARHLFQPSYIWPPRDTLRASDIPERLPRQYASLEDHKLVREPAPKTASQSGPTWLPRGTTPAEKEIITPCMTECSSGRLVLEPHGSYGLCNQTWRLGAVCNVVEVDVSTHGILKHRAVNTITPFSSRKASQRSTSSRFAWLAKESLAMNAWTRVKAREMRQNCYWRCGG